MSKQMNSPIKLQELLNDLSRLGATDSSDWTGDDDMLSLMVNEALKGVDITAQYPDFYQELLTNAALREAFLDVLTLIEKDERGLLAALPNGPVTSLDFLAKPSRQLDEKTGTGQSWLMTWQRTINDLQALFSPPERAYRADPSLTEDPWFTLLQEEFQANQAQYAVVLECALLDDQSALSTVLDIAVTFKGLEKLDVFPLKATLHWGVYQESLLIEKEGRLKFAEIPLDIPFDDTFENITANLDFTLEAAS